MCIRPPISLPVDLPVNEIAQRASGTVRVRDAYAYSWYIRSSKIYMYCTTARAADCQVTLLTQISLFFLHHQSSKLSQGSRVVESSESQDIAIIAFVFIHRFTVAAAIRTSRAVREDAAPVSIQRHMRCTAVTSKPWSSLDSSCSLLPLFIISRCHSHPLSLWK